MRTAAAAVVLAILAAACGQKGGLYLREEPPPGYKPKAEQYKPVPYPKSSERDGASVK
jgi:predicted small lipoprotein YifL